MTDAQKKQIDELLKPLGYTAIKTSDFLALYERHELLLALENRIGGHIVRDEVASG